MSKELTVIDEVRNSITKMAPQFKMALPSHVSPDKFIRVLMTGIQNNKSILDADRTSLYSAAMKAAASGLLLDNKESSLVKFGNQVVFMPMVAGILKQMRNSGELLTITAHVVYEKDLFEYYINSDGEHLKHVPVVFGDRGEVKGTYALGKTKDGGVYIELMTEAEIQSVRNVSRSKGSGPWTEWPNEMRKKTAIRRLSKRMPMSTDITEALHADDDMYDLKQTQTIEPPTVVVDSKPQAAPVKKSRLSKALDAETVPMPQQQEPMDDQQIPI